MLAAILAALALTGPAPAVPVPPPLNAGVRCVTVTLPALAPGRNMTLRFCYRDAFRAE